MIYRFLVYDRQDNRFKFVADLDFHARTAPRVVWKHLEGRRRLRLHTAEFVRYQPYALYRFDDKTHFPESFPTHPSAWEWVSRTAVASYTGISQIQFRELVRDQSYDRWEKEGCPDGRHLNHWLNSEKALGHLKRTRTEVAKFEENSVPGKPGLVLDSIKVYKEKK